MWSGPRGVNESVKLVLDCENQRTERERTERQLRERERERTERTEREATERERERDSTAIECYQF